MEVKYEITEEDYIKFNIYHIQQSKAQKKTYYPMKYLLPAICGILIFYSGIFFLNQPALYWAIIALSFIVIYLMNFPRSYKKLLTKSIRSVLKEGDNSSLLGKKTLIIDNNGLKVFDNYTTEVTTRNGIKEITIYEDMILIYLSGFTAHIVPTRYLTIKEKKLFLKELEFSEKK
ncbi:hypothetical protein SAMN04488700_1477 [Carnobacterium iners]|uniref:Uncharacterized protein n=1 Tax=Carnobacterium iners TaxID=1073423 RepID=A0A1X7N7R7_9LACT|nr:YcxB family protein [Carnobacterium iners]SEK45919.1 hypothetical protein SAMN04488114_10468 [Carnobacterium iners]SMH33036.1 hypothetical protein SAMN04488700_1477 [Carnobacterium iners]